MIEKFELSRYNLMVMSNEFREILTAESHHDHKIFYTSDGPIHWQPNEMVKTWLSGRVKLDDVCRLLTYMGYNKNSEVYRKLYRDCGYSLMQYWDIFYNPDNNPKASEYKPNAK